MKRNKQCPKCESTKIGYVNYQPDADGQYIRWRVIAQVRQPERWGATSPRVGELEAYICTECGYYESYVKDPENTPWEDLSGFRMLNPTPESEGPYR